MRKTHNRKSKKKRIYGYTRRKFLPTHRGDKLYHRLGANGYITTNFNSEGEVGIPFEHSSES